MNEADSLERIVPDALDAGDVTGQATLALHLERYRWAAAQIPVGLTLDLACGVGYGSVVLAERSLSAHVVGADISRTAIAVAHRDYPHPRVDHVRGDGTQWARSEAFRAIVSLETLEHVEQPLQFMKSLVEHLAPGGVLVVSVPVTPSVDANPHHRTDFTRRSILAMGHSLGLTLMATLPQKQSFGLWKVLRRSERRTRDVRSGLIFYYLRHPTAAARRAAATLRYGFVNHYLTTAWTKPEL